MVIGEGGNNGQRTVGNDGLTHQRLAVPLLPMWRLVRRLALHKMMSYGMHHNARRGRIQKACLGRGKSVLTRAFYQAGNQDQ
jgi:hypothetical protein